MVVLDIPYLTGKESNMKFDKEPVLLRLTLARKAKGLSQRQLSDLLVEKYDMMTDQQSVSDWETGKHSPKKLTKKRIEEILEVKIWRD
jgi:transcriptional regulator with XRE-family HTH domain